VSIDPYRQDVIYPIADDIDGEGNQLINWTPSSSATPLR